MADSTLQKQTQVGRQVVRNIPVTIKSAVHGVTKKGIVTAVSETENADQENIAGEDGIDCTVITENYSKSISFTVTAEEGTVAPKPGDLISPELLEPLGVEKQGVVIVESGGSRDWDNKGVCSISFTAVWKPWVDSGQSSPAGLYMGPDDSQAQADAAEVKSTKSSK